MICPRLSILQYYDSKHFRRPCSSNAFNTQDKYSEPIFFPKQEGGNGGSGKKEHCCASAVDRVKMLLSNAANSRNVLFVAAHQHRVFVRVLLYCFFCAVIVTGHVRLRIGFGNQLSNIACSHDVVFAA